MIDLIISATVGAIAGSAIMRRIDLRKIVEARHSVDILARVEGNLLAQIKSKQGWIDRAHAGENSSARLSDALATKQARIDRALSCETPKAAHGVKKMAAILRGER